MFINWRWTKLEETGINTWKITVDKTKQQYLIQDRSDLFTGGGSSVGSAHIWEFADIFGSLYFFQQMHTELFLCMQN